MAKKNNDILFNILKSAENERIIMHHPYVGSEHLFLALLKNKSSLTVFLNNYNVTYNTFKKELIKVVGKCKKDNPENLYTPLLRKIIKRYENKHYDDYNYVEEDFFVAILDEGEGIAIRILLKMDVDLDEVYFKLKETRKVHNMELSNKIGICLNNYVSLDEKVIGREKEIDEIIETLLRKKKCNPILIGPAGVGKTAIVEELARRIEKGIVPDILKDYKIYMIEMGTLISGTKYRGEFEERLTKIINEIVTNKKTILFIDEIHSLVGAGGADGAINASDILKPYLARGDVKCIGATTTSEYESSIVKDQALSRRFNVIEINEPTNEEMYYLLCEIKKEYEKFHNIRISNKVLKKIIELSDLYLKNIVNPDKSIDLLDSACAYAKMKNDKQDVTEEDVFHSIFQKTSNYLISNKSYVNNLKEKLKKEIENKDVIKICNALKYDSTKPISFVYDDENIGNILISSFRNINHIKIDFQNYNQEHAEFILSKNNSFENLSFQIKKHPFSILTIDNLTGDLNEAIKDIIRINNEGYIMTSEKEKLSFHNMIILVNASKLKSKNKGFGKTTINDLPIEFINSFKCNLIGIKKKKVNIS